MSFNIIRDVEKALGLKKTTHKRRAKKASKKRTPPRKRNGEFRER
jgi:hypothetical protein